MNTFLITYEFSGESEAAWHQEIATFIAALKADPELDEKVSYRCLKSAKSTRYYHLATVPDEETVKLLGSRDFFKHYTQQTELASHGTVEVIPLTLINGTEI